MFELKIIGGTIVDGTGAAALRRRRRDQDGVIVAVASASRATRRRDRRDRRGGRRRASSTSTRTTTARSRGTRCSSRRPSTASRRSSAATAASASRRCAPTGTSWLIELMEGVEDIPGTALHEGIQWEWETFPEYLDALDRAAVAMDVGTQVAARAAARLRDGRARGEQRGGHPRRHRRDGAHRARGDGGGRGRLLDVARRSATRTSTASPCPAPSRPTTSCSGLAQRVVDAGGGVFEVVPQGETERRRRSRRSARSSSWRRCRRRPTSRCRSSCVQSRRDPDLWRQQLEMVEKANAKGARRHRRRSRPGPAACSSASRATTRSHAGPRTAGSRTRCPTTSCSSSCASPTVKAAILGEDDLPPDPHRQYESLADSAPFMLGQRLPARRPARLRADSPSGRSRGVAAATGRRPFEVLYDHLAARRAPPGAVHELRPGDHEDHLAEMITHPTP